jgi:hypothetical protein
MARAIDLSLPLVVNTADQNVGELEQSTHESGSARVNQASAALREQLARDLRLDAIPQLDATTFPDGLFLSNEFLKLSVHGGNHLDAPFHYGPTSNGHPAEQITGIPLEWCLRPGVVLRFRDHRPLQSITAADVDAELERIGYRIRPRGHRADRDRPGRGAARSSVLHLPPGDVRRGDAHACGDRSEDHRYRYE